jgi:hypothetical protein
VGELRQQGDVADGIAREEQVNDPARIDNLQCSSADDQDVVESFVGTDDRCTGREVLDLHMRGEAREVIWGQRVEWWLAAQEVDELLHTNPRSPVPFGRDLSRTRTIVSRPPLSRVHLRPVLAYGVTGAMVPEV